MKAKLFAGALALGLWGGAALADETQVTATTGAADQVSVKVEDAEDKGIKEMRRDEIMRGVSLSAGAGVEGYTGSLSSSIQPGVTWGVTAGIKPTRVLGIELGYSGAVNELRDEFFDVNGADIVRNGAQAVATLGLTSTPVQPYLLAGIGVNWYRARAGGMGFVNDTSGNVPLGGGLRAHIGHFTADARLDYNLLFSNDLAGSGAQFGGYNANNAGRYQGTLSVGSTF